MKPAALKTHAVYQIKLKQTTAGAAEKTDLGAEPEVADAEEEIFALAAKNDLGPFAC